jgi:hypothetical protein
MWAGSGHSCTILVRWLVQTSVTTQPQRTEVLYEFLRILRSNAGSSTIKQSSSVLTARSDSFPKQCPGFPKHFSQHSVLKWLFNTEVQKQPSWITSLLVHFLTSSSYKISCHSLLHEYTNSARWLEWWRFGLVIRRHPVKIPAATPKLEDFRGLPSTPSTYPRRE